MGNYTRMKFASVLSANTPIEIVDVLSAMAAGDFSHAKAIAPNHALFVCERWTGLLRGTYALPVWPEADGRLAIKRNENGSLTLAFHTSTKNYDNEVDKFLDWIGPHVVSGSGDVLGEFERDEDNRRTLLIAQAERIDKVPMLDKHAPSTAMGF